MRTLLEVNGKQLYVEIFGPEHAPVVLYLHGGPGASCYDFIYFQKALLETDLRVVAIDQRGVLRSEAIAEDEPFGMNDLVNDCEALRKAVFVKIVVPIRIKRLTLISYSILVDREVKILR